MIVLYAYALICKGKFSAADIFFATGAVGRFFKETVNLSNYEVLAYG